MLVPMPSKHVALYVCKHVNAFTVLHVYVFISKEV